MFSVSRATAQTIGNPFKVICQDLANRKQNISRMKTTFIWTSWRMHCPIFTIFYKKIPKVQKAELFKAKVLFHKYLCQAPHNLAKCSLYDRRFMSQAGRARYFARSARPGEQKNKALFFSSLRLALRARVALRAKYRVRPAWQLIKRLSGRPKIRDYP